MVKGRKRITYLLLTLLIGASTLQATIIEEQPNYIDTTELKLPYLYIPGFLVSPLQQRGELLAAFKQTREGYSHKGIDIRATEGSPIFASGDGIVTKAAPDSKGVDKGGGHMIFINYGEGIEARYMHLSTYGVKEGDIVQAGDIIGFTGNTGDSTTPHLHFEYYIMGSPIDPAFIFEASGIIGQEDMLSNSGIMMNKQGDIIESITAQEESFFVIQK